MKKLLIANRAEIAVRISQTARELGYQIIAIYPEDDVHCLHVIDADESVLIPGAGAAAYLNIEAIISAAESSGATAIHPGYGFLSENTDFAQATENAGMVFVGPTPDQLSRFGNKAGARALAAELNVPLVPGTNHDTSLLDIMTFWDDDPTSGIVIKAISGGGGRGMRIVQSRDDIENLFERCRSEADLAFGSDAVYVERLIKRARHIEVQILGDGQGNVVHFWERDCSSQRQNQKIVEIAPSPNLPSSIRDALLSHAVDMAKHASYRGLGTFEFLVDADNPDHYFFIEANARLQVEHTVTEAITGIDLVALQIQVSEGNSLNDLGLSAPPVARGFAIQTRINMETPGKKGLFKPTGGKLTAFEAPTGPGIRLDSMGYTGYQTSTRYDSLLAKLIVSSFSNSFETCVSKTLRALARFRIEGFKVNLPFLRTLLAEDVFVSGNITTRYIDENLSRLALSTLGNETSGEKSGLAGTRINSNDPLAVLALGKSDAPSGSGSAKVLTLSSSIEGPEGATAVSAPLQGTITEVNVSEGDLVYAGQELAVMDAMKMEHVIEAPIAGEIVMVTVDVGDAIVEDHPLLFIEAKDVSLEGKAEVAEVDLDTIRPDLQEAMTRHGYKLDENREVAVAKRKKNGHRTVRENINDICDPDTFVEYGSMAIAAQRRRRSVQDLMENTPGDGMVTGIGSVNGELFPDQDTQCIVMSYDYMVLAGTQGLQNHRKKDRMFEVAEQLEIPIILIAEGGGGRPGDTDGAGIAGLDCLAFQLYGKLSGLVPRIGITTGRCFAGNAVLLGSSDIVIATEDSNIGIGGPAMIEGGGLGIFKPEEVGPMSVQVPNGVVDIAVKDEAEATATAKKLLSYFQGNTKDWSCQDQRELRFSVPENRLRVYDMRDIIKTIADDNSVLEIREFFGIGIITVFARIEGRPVGIFANNPAHLSGAIDSDAADKTARFIQLCDAFDIPIVSLVDCPGIMVGPEIEKTALVRHAARLFVISTSITVPLMSIVIRKGYGLGAQAMTGGGFKASTFTITWPTGEFGGMGLEGAVKLGYRKELEAIEDPEERLEEYEKRVEQMYHRGKAVNFATAFEIDEVIDPKDTRHWIMTGLKSAPKPAPRKGKKKPFIDTW
ncbi:MAG: acetyl/propionyl-CoA carboxylase alpha subunit/acetyl-CoA carboxylase carboxyltransferase component [Candidatus Azotimanducaceae bacterium]|jgi:acetyl/propionyl-CoA carboxylase alpha subunit/acetyl-CoA carboxylase carboxyltransferase component